MITAGLVCGIEGPTLWLVALSILAILDAMGLHSVERLIAHPAATLSRMLLAIVLSFAAVLWTVRIAGFATLPAPTEWVAWLSVTIATLGLARAALSALATRWSHDGRFERRTVIYGAGTPCADLIRTLEADPACDLRIVGVCDDRGNARVGDDVIGYPRIGTLDDLIALSRRTRIDTVIVSLPLAAEQRLLTIFGRLSVLPADVRQPTGPASAGSAMHAILDNPITGWGLFAKAALDKLVAATALILLAPLLAAVAIAVKLDSRGPVLFRQKRYGFNNELIDVFKFRSMFVENADAAADRLVSKSDPLVTPVGRFIRKTSLDELPQLLNVLRGDLSLVGPRPHALNAKAADRLYGDVVGSYFVRHKVRPGITGWAQINGWRGETDTEEKILRRVEHDLHYIENWSLWLDAEILLRTPLALLKTDNAY